MYICIRVNLNVIHRIAVNRYVIIIYSWSKPHIFPVSLLTVDFIIQQNGYKLLMIWHYLQGFEGWQWVSHSGDYTWWNIHQCMVCVIAWSSSSTLCGEFTGCIHSTRKFSLLPHLTAAWLACSWMCARGSWIQPPLKHWPCPVYPSVRKQLFEGRAVL